MNWPLPEKWRRSEPLPLRYRASPRVSHGLSATARLNRWISGLIWPMTQSIVSFDSSRPASTSFAYAAVLSHAASTSSTLNASVQRESAVSPSAFLAASSSLVAITSPASARRRMMKSLRSTADGYPALRSASASHAVCASTTASTNLAR